MPAYRNMEPVVGRSVGPIYENYKKWLDIENELFRKFENGEVVDGPELLFAFQVICAVKSFRVPPKGITSEVGEFLQKSYGNRIYANDRRFFDGSQVRGLEIVKALSKEYDLTHMKIRKK